MNFIGHLSVYFIDITCEQISPQAVELLFMWECSGVGNFFWQWNVTSMSQWHCLCFAIAIPRRPKQRCGIEKFVPDYSRIICEPMILTSQMPRSVEAA